MNSLRKHYDKVALAICVLVFLGTASLSPLGFRKLEDIASRNPVAGLEPARYDARPMELPAIGVVSWPDASAQSSGREWVYDVFTPPVIYYNRQSGAFTVTPPSFNEPVATNAAPYDLDLLAVRQEPYRIQLKGYARLPDGTHLGTFGLMETGETINARAGADVARAEFSVRTLEVRKVTTQSRDNTPVVEEVAIATIADQRSGREETLSNTETRMMPRLQAVFRLRSSPPEERIVREGGTIEFNGQRYLVMQLSLYPPQAVVSRRAVDAFAPAETRTLTPLAEPSARTSALETRANGILSFPSR